MFLLESYWEKRRNSDSLIINVLNIRDLGTPLEIKKTLILHSASFLILVYLCLLASHLKIHYFAIPEVEYTTLHLRKYTLLLESH